MVPPPPPPPPPLSPPSVAFLSIPPRGTGVKAGGERGALCCAAVDPGVHSERGEMLTQLCPARHCR